MKIKSKRTTADKATKKYVFNENKPLYILDLNQLRAGDIILTREKKVVSISVRAATLGSYSHAMICLSPSSIIDATISGQVFTRNTQRQIFNSMDDCVVLRLKTPLSNQQMSSIDTFLRLKIATPYSLKEAMRTPFEKSGPADAKEDEQFCSRLVAQAYDYIGISLVSNPNYCSPEDIYKSGVLTEVTDILKIADEHNINIANKPDLVEVNRRETYAWLDKAITLAKTQKYKIQTINDVAQFLLEHPQYDRKICEYIQKTRYETQYLDDLEANPERYAYIKSSSLNVESELSQIKTIFKTQKNNYIASRTNYNNNRSKYNKIHKKLYTNILKHLLRRLNVLSEYVDNSPTYDPNTLALEIKSIVSSINSVLK